MRFMLKLEEADVRDSQLAKSVGARKAGAERMAATLSKALTRDGGQVPALTDSEAEQSARAWFRCRARRWKNSGYDWELDERRAESRSQLVEAIHETAIARRAYDVTMHQAIRSLGEGLRTAIEAEVATIIAMDFVPDWLQQLRDDREAEKSATGV